MTTLTLTISDSLDRKLHARAAAQGRDVATVALELVEQGLGDESAAATPSARDLTHEERLQVLLELMKNTPRIDVVVDDSRESIYEGRGE